MEGIRGRAMYRGYQMHSRYAEAFEVIKISNDTNLFTGEQRLAHAQRRQVENILASAVA